MIAWWIEEANQQQPVLLNWVTGAKWGELSGLSQAELTCDWWVSSYSDKTKRLCLHEKIPSFRPDGQTQTPNWQLRCWELLKVPVSNVFAVPSFLESLFLLGALTFKNEFVMARICSPGSCFSQRFFSRRYWSIHFIFHQATVKWFQVFLSNTNDSI